jgi:hypothetical protein
MRFGPKGPRPPQWLGHCAARANFVGGHSHFDIAAKAASLLRHILSALQNLRFFLFGPPNLSDYRASGSHTAETGGSYFFRKLLTTQALVKTVKQGYRLTVGRIGALAAPLGAFTGGLSSTKQLVKHRFIQSRMRQLRWRIRQMRWRNRCYFNAR